MGVRRWLICCTPTRTHTHTHTHTHTLHTQASTICWTSVMNHTVGKGIKGEQPWMQAGRALAGRALAGRALAGRALAGRALAGRALAGRALAGRALAGRALAGRALAGRALARVPTSREIYRKSTWPCRDRKRSRAWAVLTPTFFITSET